MRKADVLLDVGCGAGRPFALAAHMRYRRLIGIDGCASACDIAHRNLASYPYVSIEIADAQTYAIPDTVTALYTGTSFT